VFSLGGWGCNFHCQDCQNWGNLDGERDVLKESEKISRRRRSTWRNRIIARALPGHIKRASMWFEIYAGYRQTGEAKITFIRFNVTKRLSQSEALDIIGPYLDAWRGGH